MATRKQRRIRMIILGVVLLALAAVAIGFGFSNSIEFFKSPTQVIAGEAPEGTFRIGGLVEPDSLSQTGEQISFYVTDNAERVRIEYKGLLPDLFAEGQGMIARGEMQNEVFVADEILAKHDEEYMPREVIDALKASGEYRDPS